jgi:hypothetical protein
MFKTVWWNKDYGVNIVHQSEQKVLCDFSISKSFHKNFH